MNNSLAAQQTLADAQSHLDNQRRIAEFDAAIANWSQHLKMAQYQFDMATKAKAHFIDRTKSV